MSVDVLDGLMSGSSEEDVNSESGFASALAGAAGVELSAEQKERAEESDTTVSAGLTGLEEDSEKTPEADGPTEGQPQAEDNETPEVDPDLASLLAKHDGDTEAALAALLEERKNAQSLIGRQGNEVGELREKLARFEGKLEQISESQIPQPVQQADLFVSDETIEGLETLLEQRGAQGMMTAVIESRPDLIDHAIAVWGESDPVAASRFAVKYEIALSEQQAEPTAPAGDPIMESLRQERALGNAIDQARADLGLDEQSWASVRDHMTATFTDENTPTSVKKSVTSSDPAEQLEGIKDLMRLARGRAASVATADATAQVSAAAAEEAARRKQAAQVATGSGRPVTPGKSADGESSREDRIKAFHEAFLKTEDTSVAAGLTGLS